MLQIIIIYFLSVKNVLLHPENTYSSLPVTYSVHMKKTYENLNMISQKIMYLDHDWRLCGDLKVITMILRQQ